MLYVRINKSRLKFTRHFGSWRGWPGKFVRLGRLIARRGRERLPLGRLARRLNRSTLNERIRDGVTCRLQDVDGSEIIFITNQYDNYIKTEKTIHNLLFRDLNQLPAEYELMPYPLGQWINTIGVERTGRLVKLLKNRRHRVFICQHIFVRYLNFEPGDLVFTPHASIGDSFYSLPHYAVNYDESMIQNNKAFRFSFLGSTGTHWTRRKLVELYPGNCFDSGVSWGLNEDLDDDFRARYIKRLGDSDFSLCPRGTGISSVRIFESMAMDSIPVIIADGYKKPLADTLRWDDFSITVKESDIPQIGSLLNSLSEKDIGELRANCRNVYQEWFSNDNLHKTVLKEVSS